MGRVKQGRGTILGNAGEHFVVAELLRRDIIAGLSPRNIPGIDALASSDDRLFRIRVKTKSEEADSWVWMAKGKDADAPIFLGLPKGETKDDVTALVDIPKDGSPTISWFPTHVLDATLKANHRDYIAEPGKNGRKRSPSPMRRLYVDEELENLHKKHGLSWDDLRGARPKLRE